MGGPYNKGYSILGSILGSPYLGKLPYILLPTASSPHFDPFIILFIIPIVYSQVQDGDWGQMTNQDLGLGISSLENCEVF